MELSPFSSPAMYPAAAAVRAAWPGSPDHHHKQQLRLLEKQVPFHGPSSSSCCLGGGTTQFTFLQGSDPFTQARASTSAGTPSGHGLLADELLGQVPDSPRAPSLLSLPQSRTSGVGSVRLQQPSFPGTQYESIGHMVSEDAARAPDGADARCEGMFRVEPGSKVPETIPFYWEEEEEEEQRQQQHKCSGHHMNRGSF